VSRRVPSPESRQFREGGYGVAQRTIGSAVVAPLGDMMLSSESARSCVYVGTPSSATEASISAPRIRDNPERYGVDAGVDGVKVVLVPRAVIVDGDDKMRSLFGIAEHVLDQSFVDAHAIV